MNDQQEPESGERAEPSTWVTLGMVGALGTEFVVFLVVGALVGDWADERLGTSPALVILGCLVGLLASGYQVWRVTRRMFHG